MALVSFSSGAIKDSCKLGGDKFIVMGPCGYSSVHCKDNLDASQVRGHLFVAPFDGVIKNLQANADAKFKCEPKDSLKYSFRLLKSKAPSKGQKNSDFCETSLRASASFERSCGSSSSAACGHSQDCESVKVCKGDRIVVKVSSSCSAKDLCELSFNSTFQFEACMSKSSASRSSSCD
jgi:hypothetical protein